MTTLEREIRLHLGRYLAGEKSLIDFHGWLVEVTWNIVAEDDPVSYRLAGQIEINVAEYTSHHRSIVELRGALSLIEKS